MFQCKENCGECCEDGMIFNRDFFYANEGKAKRKIMVVLELKDNNVYPATFDRICPFRGDDCKCAIYDDRPELCKNFGVTEHLSCPYIDKDGNPRTQEEADKIHLEQFQAEEAFDLVVALAIPDEFEGVDKKEIERIKKGVLRGDPFYTVAAGAIFGTAIDIKKKGGKKSVSVSKEKYEQILKIKEEIEKEREEV